MYPKVSVIMGVYNCASTLSNSIDSLLAQTFTDWELIMCDDGSIDNTYQIAEAYAKKYPNIKLIKNEKNLGLNQTLNNCLKLAKGKYIARQDGDDESLPARFEKEVAFLDNNLEYAIVGCAKYHFDQDGIWGLSKGIEYPIKYTFIKGTPFSHPCTMVRREAFDAVAGYTVDARLIRVEDYHLWAKMYVLGYKGYNIQEPLYMFRDDCNSMSRRNFKARWNGFYLRNHIIRMFKLPFYYHFLTIRPLLVWCIPSLFYNYLHRRYLKQMNGRIS
ncbi:MAG: glycosyltransferase [Planctomycetaceae bacterium]|nr:glycosyltransferase [Planctomycetaceae bacterium]